MFLRQEGGTLYEVLRQFVARDHAWNGAWPAGL